MNYNYKRSRLVLKCTSKPVNDTPAYTYWPNSLVWPVRWRSTRKTQLKASWLWVYFKRSSNYFTITGLQETATSKRQFIIVSEHYLTSFLSDTKLPLCQSIITNACQASGICILFWLQQCSITNSYVITFGQSQPGCRQQHDLITTPNRHCSIAAGLERGKREVGDETNKHWRRYSAIYHAFARYSIYSGALKN